LRLVRPRQHENQQETETYCDEHFSVFLHDSLTTASRLEDSRLEMIVDEKNLPRARGRDFVTRA
jgi:hypothetical protein